jgi:hypothetical protein
MLISLQIPEILSHPWFNSSVPSFDHHNVTVVAPPQLPPSPSTLARPIASRKLIDPELLMSLRVIWGRHADSRGESIIKDLCSPAGQGVHAKAFYFLLRQYRDDSIRNNLSGKMALERVNTGRDKANFNLRWESGSSVVNRTCAGTRNHMLSVDPPYSRTSAPSSGPVSVVVAPPMRRDGSAISGYSTSRERAPSPAGPRAPATRTRGDWNTKTFAHQDLARVLSSGRPESGFGCGGPRPRPPRRGYTYSQPVTKPDVSTVQFPQQPRASDPITQRRPKSVIDLPLSTSFKKLSVLVSPGDRSNVASNTSAAQSSVPHSAPAKTIHAPIPISVSRSRLEIKMTLDSDSLTQPGHQLTTVRQSEAINGSDVNVNRLSTQTSAAPSDSGPPRGGRWRQVEAIRARGHHGPSHRVISRIYEGQDKENQMVTEQGWTTVVAEESGDKPVGLGVSRDVGKVGNVTYLPDSEAVKWKKDKKARRECLLSLPMSKLILLL